MAVSWNLWHGCNKISAGCQNCYVYRGDAKRERDSRIVQKTHSFNVPIQKDRKGNYKVKSGELVWTCFTSDFLLDKADAWRKDAWDMIRERKDLNFLFITKRIDRFKDCVPSDWEDGFDNVIVGCTVENQQMADYRLPIFLDAKIKHKFIICEPLLCKIDISPYLSENIEQVVVGGESGNNARTCEYNWVLDLREQCVENNVSFYFKQTGTFFKKDNRIYKIAWKDMHSQAKNANINFEGKFKGYIKDNNIE